MDGRRILVFERLDQVMADVDRLLQSHETLGNWSLGQILHHLAVGVRLTVEPGIGPIDSPADPESERIFRVRQHKFFRAGRMLDGSAEVPHPLMIPPPDADERASAEMLRSALGRLEELDGPFNAHPVLGPMLKARWGEFHRIHCAHHLGFVRPTAPG